MRKRRTRKRQSVVWTWLSFLAFAVIIFVLGGALITRQTPAAFLSNLFVSEPPSLPYKEQSKNELIALLEVRDSLIMRMEGELKLLKKRCGLGLATVVVENETLNMRSDPSLTAPIKARIPNGSSVVILEYAEEEIILEGEEGKWVFIEFSGDRGWVWGNYLTSRD